MKLQSLIIDVVKNFEICLMDIYGGLLMRNNIIENSGNVIYVNTISNIVIAVTSYFKPTIFVRIDFIQEYIEPFILNDMYS